jgi:hypothetical protein
MYEHLGKKKIATLKHDQFFKFKFGLNNSRPNDGHSCAGGWKTIIVNKAHAYAMPSSCPIASPTCLCLLVFLRKFQKRSP